MARPAVAPIVALVTLAAGCVTTPQSVDVPPASAVRASLVSRVEAMLEKALAAEGFAVGKSEVTESATAARNTGDAWDANAVTVTFDGHAGPDGVVRPLTTAEQAAVLANVRAALRRTVVGNDGEVLSADDGENYHERTLTLAYTMPGVVGSVQATLRPATDLPEETRNRLEILVREQTGR